MYNAPNMSDPVDRLAHYLSELHNDNAPIGWERYSFMAKALIEKSILSESVMERLKP
jgi:hypothetical protein